MLERGQAGGKPTALQTSFGLERVLVEEAVMNGKAGFLLYMILKFLICHERNYPILRL